MGRIYLDELDGSRIAAKLSGKKGAQEQAVFCGTVHSMQTLEAVAAAIHYREPVLLTGETGTGKTSLVQHLASLVGAEAFPSATSALAFDQGGSTTMYVASVKENGRNGIVTENGSGGHGPGPFGPAVAARAVQNGLFVAYNPPPAA